VNLFRRFLKQEKHPILDRNRENFAKFDWGKPIEEYEYVSVDTELTGLNQRRDAIVSIGAVRVRGLRIIAGDNFYSFVHPKRSLPKDSTLIHRITPDQVKDAPRLKDVLPEFLEFCGGALLVGHFVGMDMSFLNRASKKLLGGTISNPCVDTMKLAQGYREQQWKGYYDQFNLGDTYNLEALAEKYSLPRFEKHDSLEDAYQTACLFIFLVKNMRSDKCRTLKDFHTVGRLATSLF